MKRKSEKKIAAKEEKRKRHQQAVEIVREATRRVLSTPIAGIQVSARSDDNRE